MTPQPQTVEDLGKLVKGKYPGTYDKITNVSLGQKVKAKYPEAYGHFVDPSESTRKYLEVNAPPKDEGFFSTLGKDISNIPSSLMATGTGEKGDTRPLGIIPAMGRASHEQFQQGREAFGKGQYLSGAGHYLAGAIPGIGPIAAQAGEEFGSGQTGQGSAHAFEALAPFLFKGTMESPVGSRISSAVKVAAPDILKGTGKAGAGMATGAAMHAVGVPGSDFSTALLTRPGLRQIGQGLAAGAKELVGKGVKASDLKVEPPAKVIPPKGPSIGDLKSAVKSGRMTPEEFDAHVDQMNLTDTAKNLHKGDVRTSDFMKANKAPGVTDVDKPLSIGHLSQLVKSGKMDLDDFNNGLIKLKYGPESRGHLTELLKQQMEDEEEAAKEPEKKEPPRPSVSAGGKLGTVKSPKEEGEGTKPSPKAKDPSEALPPPGIEAFLETEPPYKTPITEHEIEQAQSTARKAKETQLARYFDNNRDIDLDKIPKTSEYLKAIGKESGLKREPSLRTLENAINRARELRVSKTSGSERGSLSLKNKVDNPEVSKAADRIFSAMKKSQGNPGNTVTFERLRLENPELKNIPKEIFDKAALKLQNDKKVLLSIHGHARALPESERLKLVHDPNYEDPEGRESKGQYYVSIYER